MTSETDTSPYGEPQTLKEITLSGEEENTERTATITKLGWNYDSEGNEKTHETGIRYLFIKAEEDNAGNVSIELNGETLEGSSGTLVKIGADYVHRFGPYVFDNAPPQVTFEPDGSGEEWKQSYNIKVTIDEIGNAGIDTNSLKYVWVEGSSVPPVSAFTNSFTAEETTTAEDGETVTQTVSHIQSPAGQTGGNWVLWVLVTDTLGESNVAESEIYKLDNAKPVMQITTGDKPSINEICQSTDVTITFKELHDDLAEDNTYEYYLSTSKTSLEKGEWKTYTNGTTIQNLGEGITGRRYLFVKAVKDKAGNESDLSVSSNSENTDSMTGTAIPDAPTGLTVTDVFEIYSRSDDKTKVTFEENGTEFHRFGKMVTIEGVNYHVFGEFIFDNAAPNVEFDPDGNDEWSKSHTTTVTINENKQGVATTEGAGNVITADTMTAEHYGGYVTNYTPENGSSVGWRVFHADGDNIYLIADYLVENQYVPAGKNGTPATPNGTYAVNILNAFGDYAGVEEVINSNNPAKKWLSKVNTVNTHKASGKVTSYILDTKVWSVFEDSKYSEYAIGGPTIELFADSYNTKHMNKTIDVKFENGAYSYKWNSDVSYVTALSVLDDDDNLYSSGNTKIAGPIGSHTITITDYVNPGPGIALWGTDHSGSGMRPVICLKSDYGLDKQANGTYKIVPKDPGEAGIVKEETKYIWKQASEGKPTVSEMTTSGANFYEAGVTAENQDTATSRTIKIQRPLTKDTVTVHSTDDAS